MHVLHLLESNESHEMLQNKDCYFSRDMTKMDIILF